MGVGYVGGLVSLAIMAGLVGTDPATGKTLLGLDPILSLDGASHEGDRLVGPFSAAWYLVFMIPFFVFVPDVGTSGASRAARRSAVAELWETLRGLPTHRDVMLFLVARMLYVDGLSAIFAFGGIYGAAVFGWRALELGLFGIILTLTGAVGALIGGVLDDRRGSKAVILGALALLLLRSAGILSVDGTHVLFAVEVAPRAPGAQAVLVGGRARLPRLRDPNRSRRGARAGGEPRAAGASRAARKMTQFFGLFAFSGKVTAFLAPLAVASVTTATGSQRAGMAAIGIFLVLGMVLMLPVRAPR